MSQTVRRLAAIGFVLGFQAYFYSRTLYNSGPDESSRLTRWAVLLGEFERGANRTENLWADALARLSHVENLRQRGPILVSAAVVFVLALLAGDVLRATFLGATPMANLERVILSFGLGMSAVSLATQLLGLLGMLSRTTLLLGSSAVALAWTTWAGFVTPLRTCPAIHAADPTGRLAPAAKVMVVVGVIPFVVLAILAACLPTTDFDALAYHLLGPKEYWLAGRITFLPHNVYTTMPFLTEMFHLLGMAIVDDWFFGVLVGQVVLAGFGLMTGLAAGALAGRLFGARAGWLAALVFLTTPWIYRLSIIPYVEGALLFFAAAGLLAALRSREQRLWSMVTGILAGSAIACKYTGLVMVAVPLGMVVAIRRPLTAAGREGACFVLGCVLAVGPWLVRNIVWTGNPVYPLAYSIFGGTDWSPKQAEQFARHHQPADFSLNNLARYVHEIPMDSDWQSPLVFGFAPLALFRSRRRAAGGLWSLVAFLFLAFWLLTHRLDRFWLPLQPFAAVLAGGAMAWSLSRSWRIVTGVVCAVAVWYNLGYCTTWMCGLNTYTADLAIRRELNVAASPAVAVCNHSGLVGPENRVLHVGSAAVFYSVPPARYNTVFNKSLFEQWFRDPKTSYRFRPVDEIRKILDEEAIDFIVVDWTEIVRHRRPGGYGFSDFVTPGIFGELVRMRVVEKLQLPRPYPQIEFSRTDPSISLELGGEIAASDSAVSGDLVQLVEAVELYRVVREVREP
jgi:hypothetical protein